MGFLEGDGVGRLVGVLEGIGVGFFVGIVGVVFGIAVGLVGDA